MGESDHQSVRKGKVFTRQDRFGKKTDRLRRRSPALLRGGLDGRETIADDRAVLPFILTSLFLFFSNVDRDTQNLPSSNVIKSISQGQGVVKGQILVEVVHGQGSHDIIAMIFVYSSMKLMSR